MTFRRMAFGDIAVDPITGAANSIYAAPSLPADPNSVYGPADPIPSSAAASTALPGDSIYTPTPPIYYNPASAPANPDTATGTMPGTQMDMKTVVMIGIGAIALIMLLSGTERTN